MLYAALSPSLSGESYRFSLSGFKKDCRPCSTVVSAEVMSFWRSWLNMMFCIAALFFSLVLLFLGMVVRRKARTFFSAFLNDGSVGGASPRSADLKALGSLGGLLVWLFRRLLPPELNYSFCSSRYLLICCILEGCLTVPALSNSSCIVDGNHSS